ncbi:hypothetical protein DM02DRAFT_133963 [Periconia macrospinosa]|uniref:Uncharacterized protein n=1 Tax=Periconia macrospinosa TaxID=97972 RepID=A0A2V1E6M2_9PLEO|nr:hypothetical protein DM02DRAFT_133963 [Periconia macrospinosa]
MRHQSMDHSSDRDNHRSLFLPDLLPCPGSRRCAFHASIFGNSNNPSETPEEWYCTKCQTLHPTTLRLNEPTGAVAATPSGLEMLPTELLLYITQFCPASHTMLALTCRDIYCKIGIPRSSLTYWGRGSFISLLARDILDHAECRHCGLLRPISSPHAWPLLKINRESYGVPPTVYGWSDFLAKKMQNDTIRGVAPGICLSLLACAGELKKPWANQSDLDCIKPMGFAQDVLQHGLTVTYKASGRFMWSGRLVTHVRYRIKLPAPWTSFTIVQRAAVFRNFYLCPHTYASKVQ